MKINIELWYRKFKGNINLKYLILLVLAGLHYEKKISDKKLKGQLKSLRRGDLQKPKKTYHCEITNQWYNDESAYEVFLDCISWKNIKYIPFDEFIKYIQLFENKSYNFALNIFGSEYIYRIFKAWNPEYGCDTDFANHIDFYIPNVKIMVDSHTCYECGCSHDNYSKDEYSNLKTISEWLHNQKKGNLKKIPFHNIDTKCSPWI